jgi:hypothetical protein
MNKSFALVLPLTVALAGSLGCASANAAQTNANGAPVSQAAQTPHSVTRRDVYKYGMTTTIVDYAGRPCGDPQMRVKVPLCLFPHVVRTPSQTRIASANSGAI